MRNLFYCQLTKGPPRFGFILTADWQNERKIGKRPQFRQTWMHSVGCWYFNAKQRSTERNHRVRCVGRPPKNEWTLATPNGQYHSPVPSRLSDLKKYRKNVERCWDIGHWKTESALKLSTMAPPSVIKKLSRQQNLFRRLNDHHVSRPLFDERTMIGAFGLHFLFLLIWMSQKHLVFRGAISVVFLCLFCTVVGCFSYIYHYFPLFTTSEYPRPRSEEPLQKVVRIPGITRTQVSHSN